MCSDRTSFKNTRDAINHLFYVKKFTVAMIIFTDGQLYVDLLRSNITNLKNSARALPVADTGR